MKNTLNVGVIGLGGRGTHLLNLILDCFKEVNVVGVCDLYEDRARAGQDTVTAKRGNIPLCTTDYKKILSLPGLDAVVTPSAWEAHFDICVDAMNAGVYVASEVGGAYSVEQCFELVRTYERTKVPCMMLENCCYGQRELTVLNMVKKGLFGEIIHCAGGYHHDLREEVAMGNINRHYRLNNYKNRCGELYPTHELGPIAKYLNINRGNRMVSLTSMASKARGINEWIRSRKGENFENASFDFAEGDVVTTCIKCARGETIVLTHDTTLPRYYTRANYVQGTKGMWTAERDAVLLDGPEEKIVPISEFFAEYEHPLWKNYTPVGGHDGMDYLVFCAFFDAVKNGTQTPIDVYDFASWAVITALSEQSIAQGSAPVSIPDFTGGMWTHREPFVRSKYCLEEVCEEQF